MLKNRSIVLIVLIICLAGVLAGCASLGAARYAANPVAGRETLMQVSTINALMAGVYDGVISSGKLAGYGDFGVGTFDALEGEMVVLDGQIYQVKTDGVAYRVPDSLGVPFAAVTYFDSDRTETLAAGIDNAGLQAFIDRLIPSNNIFYAVKITGTFSYMQTRSVPKQQKPYPPLADVTPKQAVFEFHDVTGTVVGFRCPQFVNGVNVPGYHLHFLTGDRKAGGHILDFTVKQTVADLDYTPDFLMVLPGEKSDFYHLDLSQDQQGNLEKVEK
jgi:acetolactate decarboxylase